MKLLSLLNPSIGAGKVRGDAPCVVLCGAVWGCVMLCGVRGDALCGAVWGCVVLCDAVWCDTDASSLSLSPSLPLSLLNPSSIGAL